MPAAGSANADIVYIDVQFALKDTIFAVSPILAQTVTAPPEGVNFKALESKLVSAD